MSQCTDITSTSFGAIHRDDQASELDIRCGSHDRHGLPDRGSCGGHILDPQNAIAVDGGVANKHTAFAVVLGFLAIKGERNIAATVGQRHARRNNQWDAFVGRPKQHIDFLARLVHEALDRVGIELAESLHLHAGAVFAGIHEVWRRPSAFGDKVAEGQHVGAHHELDELLLVDLHPPSLPVSRS